MKPSQLEYILTTLDDFEVPDITLEQYATTPHIASYIFQQIEDHYDGIAGKVVADLGCGCGTLALGAELSGAGFCVGFEIDENTIKIANRNKKDLGCDNVDFIQCDVLELRNHTRWHKVFDTVIMNPPFGTKWNEGIHLQFLEAAFSLARRTVYSLHKTSTDKKIQKLAEQWGVKMNAIYEVKYNLDKSYKFHKENSKDISVTVFKFDIPEEIKSL
ncbi:hypothetical protein JTE90_017839 [Oedothorax gibbosus]|uniref:Methyltransferase domain-containing protein n=1 Tax=Oedothorax gibbosus TaxID=931172 RepID=A0AAV6VAH6_9ARAC|nr:hypothetical protein JTE90_017839 [Oedothorax gibbosus]